MKISQKRSRIILFGAICIIGLIFAACSNGSTDDPDIPDPPEQSDFYYQWFNKAHGNEDVVFYEDKWLLHSYSYELEVKPIIWTSVSNTNPKTKKDYPFGFKVTGKVASGNVTTWGVSIGADFGTTWAYYIHKNKMKIITQGDDNSGYVVYHRQ